MTSTDSAHTLANFRDLGGLRLTSGGRTQAGSLLRSDAPYPGDKAPAGVSWPPRVVIDLRAPDEAGRHLVPWPSEVELINNPLFTGARLDRATGDSLSTIYQTMATSSAAAVVSALNQFSVDGSTLVHCTAGKDRTGTVIGIALLLAGVERADIVADYRRTEPAIGPIHNRMAARLQLPKHVYPGAPIMQAPEAVIEQVLDEVGGHEGGPWTWFEGHGGEVSRFQSWVDRFTATV